MTITLTRDTDLVPKVAFSRRSFLAGGAAVGAGLLMGRIVAAQAVEVAGGHPLKHLRRATHSNRRQPVVVEFGGTGPNGLHPRSGRTGMAIGQAPLRCYPA
jgi:hypothetical protein